MHSPDHGSSASIKIVRKFLHSNLSILLIVLSLILGAAAMVLTSREEEPQIVVPLADVMVRVPGRSAREVEQLVSSRLEKLLYQVDGVEYVYSMSRPGEAIVTVRFYVGEDREKSLLKLYNKIQQNTDFVPEGVTGWVVKPIEIDDVPVVTLSLSSASADDAELRRVAEELQDRLQGVPDTAQTSVVGGRPRELRVDLKPEALRGYGIAIGQVTGAIAATNHSSKAGEYSREDQRIVVQSGAFIRDARELGGLVVGGSAGRPVYLHDVATVTDGPADSTSFIRFTRGPAWQRISSEEHPAGAHLTPVPADASVGKPQASVSIAIAKKKGTNAVWVAKRVMDKVEQLRPTLVPGNMELIVTRNMGVTADHKVNELVEALVVAVLIVIALLTVSLGWRAAFIVAVAVPIVFALTLAVNLLLGYTINRVTLFALILSLGLLVDDPIVDVENIHRHFHAHGKGTRRIVLAAVNEIRPPLIAATIAVILSFLPMFFITGMMGPYMQPMALNVPVTMLMSMVVSFTITPWMSYHLLKRDKSIFTGPKHVEGEDTSDQTLLARSFRAILLPLLRRRWLGLGLLAAIGVLLLASVALPALRLVPLKMLPFDNKNEFQLVLDMPEGTTLERTSAVVAAFEQYLVSVPEVACFESYSGTPSPMDFNGLVRHYYLRREPHLADIRIILADKKDRTQQSHALGLRLRNDLSRMASELGATLKIVESPPGPPVVATLVAEVFGKPDQTHDDLRAAASVVAQRLSKEPGIADVDTTVETQRTKKVFVVDRVKAAMHQVATSDVSDALAAALEGRAVGAASAPNDRYGLPIVVRLPEKDRSSTADLSRLWVAGASGKLVAITELGSWEDAKEDQTIYHKNLRPVQYVFAEVAGRAPAEAIIDVEADRDAKDASERPRAGRTFLSSGGGVPWSVPKGIEVTFSGEGEWKITLDVFRDLGLAFAGALVAIYILLVHETGSFMMPGLIMLAIPLTILGIMPGFWLLNNLGQRVVGGWPDPVFFTATAMIGMIALAGIVTRSAVILVDFIHQSLRMGRSIEQAVVDTVVVRLRPILLTSAAAMLGAWPITIDPIFSGLAWALIFGLLASTVFTLLVIPLTYYLLYANTPGHGVPQEDAEI